MTKPKSIEDVAYEMLGYLIGHKYPEGYSRTAIVDALDWLVKKGYAKYVEIGERGKYTYDVTEKGRRLGRKSKMMSPPSRR